MNQSKSLFFFRNPIFISHFLFLFLIVFYSNAQQYSINLYAGTGNTTYNGENMNIGVVNFNQPKGVFLDANGNLYIADFAMQRIRKIASSGNVTTIAGTGTAGFSGDGGNATSAQINGPMGVVADNLGNVFFTDRLNHRIRKISTAGIISTIAGTGTPGFSGDGGDATLAQLNQPFGIAVDATGNLYIADTYNHRIRKINPSGTITTVAGTGTANFGGDGGDASLAILNTPTCVATDNLGNLLIVDYANQRIRKINPSGTITTIAGTGTAGFSGDGGSALSANLNYPSCIVADNYGNFYITDTNNHRVRMITSAGIIKTIAGKGVAGSGGDGGQGLLGSLNYPFGISINSNEYIDTDGTLYIGDTYNNKIRYLTPDIPPGIPMYLLNNSNPYFNNDNFDFGSSPVGVNSSIQNFDLYNQGTATLNLTGSPQKISITGTDAADFTITSQPTSPIASGAFSTFSIQFKPSSPGSKTATVTIENDNSTLNPFTFTLNGNGTSPQISSFSPSSGYPGTVVTITGTYFGNNIGDNIVKFNGVNASIISSNSTSIKVIAPPGSTSGKISVQVSTLTSTSNNDFNFTVLPDYSKYYVSTLAGTGSAGYNGDYYYSLSSTVNYPKGIACDANNVYFADYSNNRIRKLNGGYLYTIAGSSSSGYSGDGGYATSAKIYNPQDIAYDYFGNFYITDASNHVIRKVNSSGIISTIAGTGISGNNGLNIPANTANLNSPQGIATDAAGNIYISDNQNHRICKIDQTGIITLIAGGNGSGYSGDGSLAINAKLNAPRGLCVDYYGNIYFADNGNHCIRKINTSGVISTIAGTGVQGFSGDGALASLAQLNAPSSVFMDAYNNLYFTDTGNSRIRKINKSGIISTIAGTGTKGYNGDMNSANATTVQLASPYGICMDNTGNIYFTDTENQRIRKLIPIPNEPKVKVLNGANPITYNTGIYDLGNATVGLSSSAVNFTIQNIGANDLLLSGTPTISITGTNPSDFVVSAQPASSTIQYGGSTTFSIQFKPQASGAKSATINIQSNDLTQNPFTFTVKGTGLAAPVPVISSLSAQGGFPGNTIIISGSNFGPGLTDNIVKFNGVNAVVTSAYPYSLTVVVPNGASTGKVTVQYGINTATSSSNFTIYALPTLSQYFINTYGGNGVATYNGDNQSASLASMSLPISMLSDQNGNLYFSDYGNHRVRKINTAGSISTIAGNGLADFTGDGAAATSASLRNPVGLAIDASGNIYIADASNHRIRKISTTGIISTVAGNGIAGFSGDGGLATSASLNYPREIAVDATGNLYIMDQFNHRIRKISTSGIISTFAGNGTAGFSGDGGLATSASLNYPYGIIVDNAGNIYLSDQNNHRVRKINSSGIISTIAGTGIDGLSGDGATATQAKLNQPAGLYMDATGNLLISDQGNHVIRKINTSGIISTIAGKGTGAFSGDGYAALSAELFYPRSITMDPSGNIYIGDSFNNRIRKLSVANSIVSINPNSGVAGNTVVITGSNFVAGYSGNTVRFNGLQAFIQSASTTSITVTVPSGAKTGRVTVQSGIFNAISDQDFTIIPPVVNPGPVITGISPTSASEILLYPNPTNGLFKLYLENSFKIQASIIDSEGRMVWESDLTAADNLFQFDISALPHGMYHLKINTGQETIIKSIIKE